MYVSHLHKKRVYIYGRIYYLQFNTYTHIMIRSPQSLICWHLCSQVFDLYLVCLYGEYTFACTEIYNVHEVKHDMRICYGFIYIIHAASVSLILRRIITLENWTANLSWSMICVICGYWIWCNINGSICAIIMYFWAVDRWNQIYSCARDIIIRVSSEIIGFLRSKHQIYEKRSLKDGIKGNQHFFFICLSFHGSLIKNVSFWNGLRMNSPPDICFHGYRKREGSHIFVIWLDCLNGTIL